MALVAARIATLLLGMVATPSPEAQGTFRATVIRASIILEPKTASEEANRFDDCLPATASPQGFNAFGLFQSDQWCVSATRNWLTLIFNLD